MKKRSTRQRIAGSMALLTGGVVLVVTTTLNILVFMNGYTGEVRSLQRPSPREGLSQRFQRNSVVELTEDQETLRRGRVWRNLSQVGDEWFVIQTINGDTVVREVTGLIERQQKLLIGSIILVLIASGFAYILAHLLTKKLLKNIESLTEFVETRTVDSLHEQIDFKQLPSDDSLARLARSITSTNHTLADKIHAIQQFALYAAHELKSPLMSMRGSLDLALKTANYHKYYNRLDATVANMDSMIQSLLVTVDPHRGHEKPQPVLIKRLLNELGERMSAQYRSINYQIVGDSSLVINKPLGALTTILRNVLSNAWKYHVGDQAIQVQYSASSIIITNGVQDGNELDIESFWVPFWQGDTAGVAGHGLGLGVVQSLCSVYGWNTTITVGESNTLITTIQFI